MFVIEINRLICFCIQHLKIPLIIFLSNFYKPIVTHKIVMYNYIL